MTGDTKAQILILEDNSQMRLILTKTLKLEGYTVHQAQHGRMALKILETVTPDLIISDLNMPIMNGIEFYKALRQIQHLTAVPFVFLTSASSPEEIQAGRELGVEDYLIKPVEPEDLLGIVQARLTRSLDVRIALINQAYLDTVTVLANTIEGRDPYTRGHVERVAGYAERAVRILGWDEERIRWLKFGAILHDIGKIIVPDQILKKKGPLSQSEWELMRKHPVAGSKIVAGVRQLKPVLPYIFTHHEHWDGNGYPQGLKGNNIPIEGRLLVFADIYDALVTHRPYHQPRKHAEVIQFIKLKTGEIFDPALTPIFIDVFNSHPAKE